MTSGEQSFSTLLWIVIGSVVAVFLGGGNWLLAAVGMGIGLCPVMMLCNQFSRIERNEHRSYRPRHHRCRRR